MPIQYKVEISLNLASVFSAVDELTKSVNTYLAAMGYDEKIMLRGKPLVMTLTVERELTQEEIEKMKNILIGEMKVSFPNSNPICESFRRQSGNVEQLVSQ